MNKLDFFEEVESDLLALPKDIFEEANNYFKKYMEDPLKYSQKLFNKDDLNSLFLLQGELEKDYVPHRFYEILVSSADLPLWDNKNT